MAFDHQRTINGIFLASLMILYTFKLESSEADKIESQSYSGKGLAKEQDKYFKNYQNLLTSYAET